MSEGAGWDWMEDVAALFSVLLLLPGKAGPTAQGPLILLHFEKLEFLSLVHVKQNLPDTSTWLFFFFF